MVKTIKALPMFYRILQDEERAIFKEESIVSSVIITSFKKKKMGQPTHALWLFF